MTGGGAGHKADAPLPGAADALIVGYGNPLRGDDGLGWHAAALLEKDPRLRGARVRWQHQLTPELAADISTATLLVLIDARAGIEPGLVSVVPLPGAPEAGSAWTHHIDPTTLTGLALELFGSAPPVFVVSVGAADFEVGERLTPEVERALPEVVEAVVRIVAEHGGQLPG